MDTGPWAQGWTYGMSDPWAQMCGCMDTWVHCARGCTDTRTHGCVDIEMQGCVDTSADAMTDQHTDIEVGGCTGAGVHGYRHTWMHGHRCSVVWSHRWAQGCTDAGMHGDTGAGKNCCQETWACGHVDAEALGCTDSQTHAGAWTWGGCSRTQPRGVWTYRCRDAGTDGHMDMWT